LFSIVTIRDRGNYQRLSVACRDVHLQARSVDVDKRLTATIAAT